MASSVCSDILTIINEKTFSNAVKLVLIEARINMLDAPLTQPKPTKPAGVLNLTKKTVEIEWNRQKVIIRSADQQKDKESYLIEIYNYGNLHYTFSMTNRIITDITLPLIFAMGILNVTYRYNDQSELIMIYFRNSKNEELATINVSARCIVRRPRLEACSAHDTHISTVYNRILRNNATCFIETLRGALFDVHYQQVHDWLDYLDTHNVF
jgi:hypothetical protein